ncbi:hypothetical protein DKZ22_09520 [Limosilactobacillus reuteri]|uniref:Homing endonuclease LAGLIDADG domain-containing protein n=1 Tax=Limosilactobacillus reuteri TaxID=1598 RepID=A0A855XAW5_LIMRT|nr:LAGLIDADG family homing endonuclease [Limosilactobacillus reuteri]PWT34078.1 hypothetical protein DKZ21_00325 [Limosilactobacillus reuteri]PWT40091.1 hypothetical protein DKZ22_09520 [Limosilactobacillus reuteri]PWT45510.1 hypothetical protein DKZ25_00325 [Limosilactobacillus reuteri]PWT68371.1 hypothetical protein DKZ26_09400 [Limosilactobacillus reuteri]
MRRIFTDKELNFIQDHYLDMTYQEITDKLNEFNDIKKTNKQVRTKASVMGLSKKKHDYDRRYFEYIDTSEKAYWLGFMFADGYITRKERENGQTTSEVAIELNEKDCSHLQKFNEALGNGSDIKFKIQKDRMIKSVHVRGGHKTVTVRYYSSEMYFDLVDKGVVQNKTYRFEFPKVEEKYFFNFLLGVIDGDGYISGKEYLMVGIVNPNLKFLKYVQESLFKYDIKTHIHAEDKWKYRLTAVGKNAEALLSELYKNAPVYLRRKYVIYKQYTLNTGLAS